MIDEKILIERFGTPKEWRGFDQMCASAGLPKISRKFCLKDVAEDTRHLERVHRAISEAKITRKARAKYVRLLATWTAMLSGLMEDMPKCANREQLIAVGRAHGAVVTVNPSDSAGSADSGPGGASQS